MLFSEKALSFSSRNSPPKKEQLLTNVSFFRGGGRGKCCVTRRVTAEANRLKGCFFVSVI